MESEIQNTDFSLQKLDLDEYENVEFTNCTFTDLINIDFNQCTFKNCNLSNVQFNFTGLQSVTFAHCKLIGADFSKTRDLGFSVTFDDCLLDYTTFDKKKLNKSIFKNCRIHGANFTQADLSKCVLLNCDLYNSLFDNTNLSGVDFTTCRLFSIDPQMNNIKKAKFLAQDLPGLLYRHDIVIV